MYEQAMNPEEIILVKHARHIFLAPCLTFIITNIENWAWKVSQTIAFRGGGNGYKDCINCCVTRIIRFTPLRDVVV